jgi:peptidoglycan hydrolase CwlO-like protein
MTTLELAEMKSKDARIDQLLKKLDEAEREIQRLGDKIVYLEEQIMLQKEAK